MPSINVSEQDFMDVAFAASDAHADGQYELAQRLDKIARKINAALTGARARGAAIRFGMPSTEIKWQDMPSTLGERP